MAGPPWLAVGVASLMLLIAVSSAGRLALSRLRGWHAEPDVDGLHVLMGVAMAGMFEPRLSPVPYTAWLAVFAVTATWFAWRTIHARASRRASGWRCAHPAPHAVECAAMIYMLLPGRSLGHPPAMAMPGMPGMSGMSSPVVANPAVSIVLALFMLGYILWIADQLTTLSRAEALAIPDQHAAAISDRPERSAALVRRLTACNKIVMGMAMSYMLMAML